MILEIDFHVPECECMKIYPKPLFYKGNPSLLQRQKISIVGTRRPNAYSKALTMQVARELSNQGICLVSGGAEGIDGIVHSSAGTSNTIMVSGTGLDIRYPSIHKTLIQEIEQNGLVLSQFSHQAPSLKWNFPLRNELIVALGESLIVPQADMKSGTMHSIEYALKMKKSIYVFPHRLGESEGTNYLLKEGLATPIYDIAAFVALVTKNCKQESINEDKFLLYCDTYPFYHEAVQLYADKIFEYECLGKITIENGRIKRI